ncbi:hypothetical protein Bbelb_131980 [Branchiostoma belcheri]|nr:hypothetical protein Bbelb_131980 [Branchiostoma belcheri]
MSDQDSRQIQEQGQADQPSVRMTTQVGAQGTGAERQGAQPGGQSGGLGPAGQQMHLQAPEQAAAASQADPIGQAAVKCPPVLAASREQPTPAFEAAVMERREGGFGGATIRIKDAGLAAAAIVGGVTVGASYVASQATQSPAAILGTGIAAGAMSLAAFWLANRQKTDKAIRKAVEKDGHIIVEKIEKGSLLIHVKFLSQAGYWVLRSFNEKIHQGTGSTCLQLLLEDEFQKIGWTGLIQVGLEGWLFEDEQGQEEEQERETGTEQEGERSEWAGMVEKQTVPPSVTTGGDSGLPEDMSSIAAMSITSAHEEVEEGSLKWQTARLQEHKDSPTAQRHIKAHMSWEEGAEILTRSGYTDLGGVKALVNGFMQPEKKIPSDINTILYGQSCLNLNKAKLMQLMTSQLQADPTDSTCLLLTALQLPNGDSRVHTLQQVVDAILQHGSGDWLYQHLHHIYCYLGWAIWEASPDFNPTMMPTMKPSALAKALSAMASSLMHKQDRVETVYSTALLSKKVSETSAIRQFEHLLRLAPDNEYFVPPAHYHLAILYNQQQDRQKVIHHFSRGQETETIRLPLFGEVSIYIKDPAKKAYEQVNVE